jgi:nitrite reductase/ring-hydroxylating ferredoxin subunit
MKPTGLAADSAAHPTAWSAPLEEILPGHAAKFHILWHERLVEGFAVNVNGRYYAYVNYCVHAGTPLDWWPNQFFSDDGRFLSCGTHGSLFEPETGKCAGGPCTGGALFSLRVQVAGGRIVVTPD